MSRSAQLHHLIATLSRGEKRQFKIHVSKYETESKNIPTQLFDLLDSMPEYDEDLYHKKLQGTGIEKHASVHLNHLMAQLLDSLRIKEVLSNIPFSVNKLIEESAIISAREEYDLALKRIKKAKQIATEAELFEKLLEILKREREIQAHLLRFGGFHEYYKTYFEEHAAILGKLENQAAFHQLLEEIHHLLRSTGPARSIEDAKRYHAFYTHPLMVGPDQALSLQATGDRYRVLTCFHTAVNDPASAESCLSKHVSLIEAHPLFMEANPMQYLDLLNQLLRVRSALNDENGFREILGKMRQLPAELPLQQYVIQRRIFEPSYREEFDWYLRSGSPEKLNALIPYIDEEIHRLWKEEVATASISALMLLLAIYYLRTNQLEKAEAWVRRILKKPEAAAETNTISQALLLDLLLQVRLGNNHLAEKMLVKTQKHFRKRERLVQAHNLFFKAMHQLLMSKDSRQVEEALKNLKTQLHRCPDADARQYYEKYLAAGQWATADFNLRHTK